MEIIVIAAMAANRVIGRKNRIPWKLPGEQKRFKETTWGHTIIMGRKTYESIGKPLPGRRNIIVSRNLHYTAEGCEVVASLDQAYRICKGDERVFNIGGEQLYRQGIKSADTLIITVLQQPFTGDTFFPDFSQTDFQLIESENITTPIPYSIQTYRRINQPINSAVALT